MAQCKPFIHSIEDNEFVVFTMDGLVCPACGTVDEVDSTKNQFGVTQPHITMPSGVYRSIMILVPHKCSECGTLGTHIAIPCEDAEFMMRKADEVAINQDSEAGVQVHAPALRGT